MGIASAFYTALSGLSVNSASLSVIGNNLANLNTIGFKGSSTTFQDLFSTNLGASPFQGNGNPCQVGLGAQVGAVMQNFGQSTFQSTSNPLDMALQGNGFFYVRALNGNNNYAHTRAGNFTVNPFGFVVDPSGNRLQGYNRDAAGKIDTTLGSSDIKLPIGETVVARSTERISFTTNLDANAVSMTNNARYTSPIRVYDSLGTQHNVLITYDKLSNNQWAYYVWSPDSVPLTSAPTLPATLGGGNTIAEGTLDFNNDGSLNAITRMVDGDLGTVGTDVNPQFSISWSNGSASNNITWEINTSLPGGTPKFKITQVDSAPGTSDSSQDGYGAGTVMGLTVDQNGFIIGTFTNGQTYALAQVALSIFTNNHGLQKIGENLWKETIASGPSNVGTAGDLGRGQVLGAHYEMSNVDVADEFTRLIITQRGYQANSRIVTTSDEMMQETLSLKR